MFFFFIGLVFVNLFLYYGNYLFLVFLFVDIFFLAKKSNLRLFFILIIGLIFYFTININYFSFFTNKKFIEEQFEVVEKKDSYSIVENNGGKYLIYNNDYEFYNGSILYLEGKIESITNSYNSFYTFLNKKGVNYEISYNKLYILENDKKFNEIVIDSLLDNKSEVSKSYLKLILFNDKDELNEEFYNTFSIYSLTYLIAVSGFHIRLLLSFFKKLFHKNIIGYSVVGFYLYLLNFSVSSYRAFLCYVIKKINKGIGFKLSNNDILSLIGSVFIIVNPSVVFSLSFIYSFLATFVLEIFKIYTKKTTLISFYIYLINIPIMLLNYYKLNFSTLFFSWAFSLPISFLYVFSFLYLFLDKFYLLYEIVVGLFIKSFSFFNKFNCVVIFGKPSVAIVIVYYIFLMIFFVLKERKSKVRIVYLFFVFVILGYQYYKPIINSNEKFYFLNVGQGDCSVFIIPNSKDAILVDTGGNKYSDVATKKIIPFLESKGINKLRRVIITHDDFDHNGALNSLKENFAVEEVIETSNIKEINIGNAVFKNLNVNEKRDNDGSIVLLGEYGGYRLLLMGDASKYIEKKIVFDVGDIDIVKIGHHGSNTSSDYEFLDRINGKIAIISVGKNNGYGHPHQEVLGNLYDLGYVVLRTDENNNIGFGKNILGFSFVDYFK